MKRVLVINTGSSSIKLHLYEMANESLALAVRLERIGEDNSTGVYRIYSTDGTITERRLELAHFTHSDALQHIFDFLENEYQMSSLTAIGHRVVHGGDSFKKASLINADVIAGIRTLIPLAPIHNPVNLLGIETAQQHYPHRPQVAVFDTAFFQTLPAHAYHYGLPYDLCQQHHIRRYGFHGTSHQYVCHEAARYLQKPLSALRIISLHLGNGASAAAIQNSECIDTSMGMSPLEGLIMGTRCGDIDPSILTHLNNTTGMSLSKLNEMLNQESGLKGLCGYNDMRDIHRLAKQGNEQARLAIEMYCYRIRKYIGAYFAALNGLDVLVFTAGTGEHDHQIRNAVCHPLHALGIDIDNTLNQQSVQGATEISSPGSQVKVLVIPGNEELAIARQTLECIQTSNTR